MDLLFDPATGGEIQKPKSAAKSLIDKRLLIPTSSQEDLTDQEEAIAELALLGIQNEEQYTRQSIEMEQQPNLQPNIKMMGHTVSNSFRNFKQLKTVESKDIKTQNVHDRVPDLNISSTNQLIEQQNSRVKTLSKARKQIMDAMDGKS